MVKSELDPALPAHTILVVEDDVLVRALVCDALRDGGLQVVDLAKRLKLDFPHLKTVLTSGHLLPDDVEKGTLLIMKPYPIDEIAGRIMAILEDRERAG